MSHTARWKKETRTEMDEASERLSKIDELLNDPDDPSHLAFRELAHMIYHVGEAILHETSSGK